MTPQPIGITADQWADVGRQLSADVRASQAELMAGVRADNAVALSLSKNPEFFENLPMATARYEEQPVRNVARPAVVADRDPVLDYARANIADAWKDGVREASYSGVDQQFSDAFDGLLVNPAGATPRAVPGQQMSDALYLAGPVPIARYDLGIASLTVNGALNFVNGVANAGLNALGALTEPLDRYQGEITSVETGLGPLGMAAAAPTLLLGRLSSVIRAEGALNARFLSSERLASQLGMSSTEMLGQTGGVGGARFVRTEGLGTHASIAELRGTGALPGEQGVIITDRTVRFGDVYELGTLGGRNVEFSLVTEWSDGQLVKKLYSGDAWTSPVPRDARLIGHGHPNENAFQMWPSAQDMNVVNARYFRALQENPNAMPAPTRIFWGPGNVDNTIFFPGFGKSPLGQ